MGGRSALFNIGVVSCKSEMYEIVSEHHERLRKLGFCWDSDAKRCDYRSRRACLPVPVGRFISFRIFSLPAAKACLPARLEMNKAAAFLPAVPRDRQKFAGPRLSTVARLFGAEPSNINILYPRKLSK